MWANKSETAKGAVKWSETGDSFIVVDTERFMKLLPNYFKTCNYASFVRQLNMYDFHKVKSMKNHQEFKHPFFTKSRFQDLALIKRKKVMTIPSPKTRSVNNDNEAMEQLKAELNMTQQQFQIVMNQNQNLADLNKEVVNQLCRFRNICESRNRKVFYMLFALMNQFDNDLIRALETPLRAIGIWVSEWSRKINKEVVGRIFGRINELLSVSNTSSFEIVDQLLDAFYNHYNNTNVKFNKLEDEFKQGFDSVKYKKVINPVFQDFVPSLTVSPRILSSKARGIFLTSIKNSHNASMVEEKLKSERNSFFEQNLLDFENLDFDNINSSLMNSPSLPHFTLNATELKFGQAKWADDAGFGYRA